MIYGCPADTLTESNKAAGSPSGCQSIDSGAVVVWRERRQGRRCHFARFPLPSAGITAPLFSTGISVARSLSTTIADGRGRHLDSCAQPD
jgi:hypothetical protein